MSETLNIDPDAVVGKLIRVWIWADQQTENGNAKGVTHSLLDRVTNTQGFGKALLKTGWLEGTCDSLTFVNFDRHNGKPAKTRALSSHRTKEHRSRKCNGVSVTPSSLLLLLSSYNNINEKAWEEFLKHRGDIRKPLSELAITKNLNILEKLTPAQQQDSVDATISNDWTGLFPPKEAKKKTKGKTGRALDVIKKYA